MTIQSVLNEINSLDAEFISTNATWRFRLMIIKNIKPFIETFQAESYVNAMSAQIPLDTPEEDLVTLADAYGKLILRMYTAFVDDYDYPDDAMLTAMQGFTVGC